MLRSRCIRTCLVLALTLTLAATSRAGTHFVDASKSTGADDGTSWVNAFAGPGGLRRALLVAAPGDEVWVARGTYFPTRTSDRTKSLQLFDGVSVYGGFAGGETELGQRDPTMNETILSGDLGEDDASGHYADNSLCVVRMRSSVLDGFTIEGGNADGTGLATNGAGIQALEDWLQPAVRRCLIRGNRCAGHGAGVLFQGFRATFQDCRFMNNAAGSGGAVYLDAARYATFTDCRFEGNHADWVGGAVSAQDVRGEATFDQCRFEGNVAGQDGGAASISTSYGSFQSCVFTGNAAPAGSAIKLALSNSDETNIGACLLTGNTATWGTITGDGAVTTIHVRDSTIAANTGGGIQMGGAPICYVTNSILYATGPSTNIEVRYSCAQGLYPGPGNIAADPQFVDAAGGNFRLKPTSPCIDAADSSSIAGYDLDGTPRHEDVAGVPDTGAGMRPFQDMGPFETPGGLFTLGCVPDSGLTRPCPCGPPSSGGSGCHNSTNHPGGMIVASGTAQPDTVVITGTGMPSNTACILLQGDAIDATGYVLGDGLRCIGGSLKRLAPQTSTNDRVSFPASGDPSISARSAALGDPIQPGQRRHYQVWYRDPNPTFCPPPEGGATNLTSAITVYW